MALGEGATLSPRKQAGAQSASADSRNQELSAWFVVLCHLLKTPVVRISKLSEALGCDYHAKLEYLPPDRFAKLILVDLPRRQR